MKTWKVGILLFNNVEVLDFAGPFEVLSISEYENGEGNPFVVRIISPTGEQISARNGLKVQPDYSFDDHPELDILIVPGGPGVNAIENDKTIIEWIKSQSEKAEILASVCTGAILLAKAGLLDGKQATTHWKHLDRLEMEFPEVSVQRNSKYVDQGSIITSAGISAGIDMALYLVGKLVGEQIAVNTAKRMEYTPASMERAGQ